MSGWSAGTKGDASRQAIGAVLSARFALTEILALNDEAVGLAEDARVVVAGACDADDHGAFRQQ